MIKGILAQYTKQALWLLAAVIHSKDPERRARAQTITGNSPVSDSFHVSNQAAVVDILCVEPDSKGQYQRG